MNEYKKCHRLGHKIRFGLDSKGNYVKLCTKCGIIWRRFWIKDISLTKKIISGKVDVRKYEEIPLEQIIKHEQDLGRKGKHLK